MERKIQVHLHTVYQICCNFQGNYQLMLQLIPRLSSINNTRVYFAVFSFHLCGTSKLHIFSDNYSCNEFQCVNSSFVMLMAQITCSSTHKWPVHWKMASLANWLKHLTAFTNTTTNCPKGTRSCWEDRSRMSCTLYLFTLNYLISGQCVMRYEQLYKCFCFNAHTKTIWIFELF